MDLIISILALIVALAALIITLASASTRSHFDAYSQARIEIGPDGQERESWSFSASRANTFIGATIGRVYIALVEAKFNRDQRKRRKAAK